MFHNDQNINFGFLVQFKLGSKFKIFRTEPSFLANLVKNSFLMAKNLSISEILKSFWLKFRSISKSSKYALLHRVYFLVTFWIITSIFFFYTFRYPKKFLLASQDRSFSYFHLLPPSSKALLKPANTLPSSLKKVIHVSDFSHLFRKCLWIAEAVWVI